MHIIWLRGLYTTVPFRMKWSVVQSRSCLTLCDPMDCSTPGFPVLHNPRSLPKLMSIELVTPSNHLILCHPFHILPFIFPRNGVFSNELALRIRWPQHWSFSFSTSPSNEYSGLISFRIDWFDLLAFQGTLKSLLEHHSSKASIKKKLHMARGYRKEQCSW